MVLVPLLDVMAWYATPGVRVLVVSIPDIYRLWQLGRRSNVAVFSWALVPGCGSMLAKPRSNAAADDRRRHRVAARINAFNGQLAAACKAYRHCRWDGGEVHQVPFGLDLVDPVDHFHTNRSGQAKLTEVTYPGDFDW
jgi:hypothetical protein